jgi:hypothetical protein
MRNQLAAAERMGVRAAYGDLIQFEQIESVIQLLDAGRPDEAKKLVATYVISDDMAERISKLMVPQLSFDDSVDHKGVLIVGNYGTGKSHLMSVLSLVAEDAAYAPMIRHPKVAEAVAPIAGKFKVLRIEVGGQMPLRHIITQQLERFLEKIGVSYTFPAADKELNNKDSFEEMMAAFAEVTRTRACCWWSTSSWNTCAPARITTWCWTWPSCARSAKSPST